jgi:hypothetical protein
MHMLLKHETASILLKALDQIAFVMNNPSLVDALLANAVQTRMRIAESSMCRPHSVWPGSPSWVTWDGPVNDEVVMASDVTRRSGTAVS